VPFFNTYYFARMSGLRVKEKAVDNALNIHHIY
jgi:hypothetical protein